MPTSTPERRARWWPETDPTGMETATRFLEERGYRPTRNWFWKLPSDDHVMTVEEEDAILYLMEEWDYGGVIFGHAHPQDENC